MGRPIIYYVEVALPNGFVSVMIIGAAVKENESKLCAVQRIVGNTMLYRLLNHTDFPMAFNFRPYFIDGEGIPAFYIL